jgi:hypothetical protein
VSNHTADYTAQLRIATPPPSVGPTTQPRHEPGTVACALQHKIEDPSSTITGIQASMQPVRSTNRDDSRRGGIAAQSGGVLVHQRKVDDTRRSPLPRAIHTRHNWGTALTEAQNHWLLRRPSGKAKPTRPSGPCQHICVPARPSTNDGYPQPALGISQQHERVFKRRHYNGIVIRHTTHVLHPRSVGPAFHQRHMETSSGTGVNCK